MSKEKCKESILAPIAQRLESFLKEEMGMEVKNDELHILCPNKLQLKDYTATIGTGGPISVLFTVSYDKKVLKELVKAFAYGEITPEEEEEMIESVACEIANTVLGNAVPEFPDKGKGVTITPPIILKEAKSIAKQKNSQIASVVISTRYGEIMVNAVGPKGLFMDELNFKEL